MNINLKSVKSTWEKLLNFPKDNTVNMVNRVCSKNYKIKLEQDFDTNEIYFESSYIPFEYSLLLNLFDRDRSWIEYYNEKGIKISKKVRAYLNYHVQQNAGNNSSLLYHSSVSLSGFAILACFEEFKRPSIPRKETLEEGLSTFIERLESSKSRIPFEEKEACILASVMALIAGNYELSGKFLGYCKNFKDVKHHYSVLNQMTKILISNGKMDDHEKVEEAFFNIFNAYRLPSVRSKREALGEYAILDNLVANYLFTWLYLKFIEGKTETTWEEMRTIMMG